MIALPSTCVMDASVVIRLFVPGAYMREVQEYFAGSPDEVHAPDLLPVECANALWKYIRGGEYRLDQAQHDLVDLINLNIHWTPVIDILPRAIEIACTYGTTAYDACYVALSEHVKLPLVTADNKLAGKLAGSTHFVMTLESVFT